MDLRTSIVTVYGPGESGKSNFIKYLLSRDPYSRHIVWDPNQEYDPEKYLVYRPNNLEYDGGNEELNLFLSRLFQMNGSVRPRYIVIDEADDFLPAGNKPMGQHAAKLAGRNTHFKPGLTPILACRRPNELHGKFRDNFNHCFVFGARGQAVNRQLRNLSEGLDKAVSRTDRYEFIHVDPEGTQTVYNPVKEMPSYERME